jgi:hypothetical protein
MASDTRCWTCGIIRDNGVCHCPESSQRRIAELEEERSVCPVCRHVRLFANLSTPCPHCKIAELKRQLAVSAETNARMLREIAALDADKRRLDWLIGGTLHEWDRELIDAAMKEKP